MTFVADLGRKIFHTTLPEVEHKPHHARFAILKSLFPAQDDFYFSHLAHDGRHTFPETRGLRTHRYSRPFRFRRPTGVNFAARELDQAAARLFAHGLIGSQLVE